MRQNRYQVLSKKPKMKEHTNLCPPTKLYLDPKQRYIRLIDPFTVEYITRSRSRSKDVGTIQTNCPLVTDVRFNYFEIKIVCWGKEGAIAIGLTPYNYDLTQQPGWRGNSWAFHQDDGHKFHNSGSGKSYTTPSKEGDTVGLLYDRHLSTITFTRNGKLLPRAFEKVSRCLLYPTIGTHSTGEKVRINLKGPFVFDFERFQEQNDFKRIIRKIPLTFSEQILERRQKQINIAKNNEEHEKKQTIILMILRNFLIKRNYLKTLKALQKDTNIPKLFNVPKKYHTRSSIDSKYLIENVIESGKGKGNEKKKK